MAQITQFNQHIWLRNPYIHFTCYIKDTNFQISCVYIYTTNFKPVINCFGLDSGPGKCIFLFVSKFRIIFNWTKRIFLKKFKFDFKLFTWASILFKKKKSKCFLRGSRSTGRENRISVYNGDMDGHHHILTMYLNV